MVVATATEDLHDIFHWILEERAADAASGNDPKKG